MRIENNAQTLDQEIIRLTDSVGKMTAVQQGLDKELEKGNHKYVRYADDFSIYTKSKSEARKVHKPCPH